MCDNIPPLSWSCESFWAGAEQVLRDGDAAREVQQPWGLLRKLQPLLLQLSLQCSTVQNMQTMVFQDFQDHELCRPSLSQDCSRTWLVLQSWRQLSVPHPCNTTQTRRLSVGVLLHSQVHPWEALSSLLCFTCPVLVGNIYKKGSDTQT